MHPYTCIVLLPDYLQDVYGFGTIYHARVEAIDPQGAARVAESQAADWFDDVSADDFRTVAVLAGHQANLLDD